MVSDLLVPRRDIVVPKMPSYVKLAMGFPIGAGAQLMDKSRYRSHGTISGAAWADGAHGRALDFIPGTPSYVEIAAAYDQLDFTTEDFSLVTRVYVDSFPNHVVFFSRGAQNIDGWRLFSLNTGALTFETNVSGTIRFASSAAGRVSTGSWLTLGFTQKDPKGAVYVNGVDVTTSLALRQNPATCSRVACIGVDSNLTSFPFDGKIEFLRIFGGIALSDSEHLAWHNALA